MIFLFKYWKAIKKAWNILRTDIPDQLLAQNEAVETVIPQQLDAKPSR